MENIKIKKAKLIIHKEDGITEEIDLPGAEIVKIEREKKSNGWYRQRLDRNKDGLLHPQIMQDLARFVKGLAQDNEDGKYIAKYDWWGYTIPVKPKTLQKRGDKRQRKRRNIYKQYLIEEIEKHKEGLEELFGKKVIIYLCFYLRRSKYEQSDLDNYAKLILDSIKSYIGDDSQITTLLMDKKLLYQHYDDADLDFLENTLIIVADEKAKKDLLMGIGS